jgi:hypothetical protein
MSESIAEMVIPGTYIEVRAEGLIGVGGIVTGNVGIVGTASRGPVGEVRTLSSLSDAIDLFGLPDSFGSPRLADSPLTLVRTLTQAFEGGARNVLAVRAANGDAQPATLDIASADGKAFTLSAKGSAGDGSSGTWGQDLTVKVVTDATAPDKCQLTITYRRRSEVFSGANAGEVFAALAASSLVAASGSNHESALLTNMASTPMTGGADGADVSVTQFADALAILEEQPVNILLAAGFSAKQVGNVVQGHLQRTLNEGRERIAVLGADAPGTATDASAVIADADALENDRVVLVAPGMVDGVDTLPPSYLAAVVAGKLSTLAPHVSLTNKTVPATPDVRYSTGSVATLLGAQVLVIRQKYGTQVVRGITTSAPPFSQISVRRTVDYAKAGVRRGSDPYIGRLNNPRVRAALRATLDGFLSQMVLDEMLTGYDLEVTATRAQEIAGICSVVMNLKPTFSIDYIRVTMNLE